MSNMDSRIVVSKGVEWTEAGGEMVLLDINRSLFFGINEVSSAIWRQLVQGKPLGEVVEEVHRDYEVDLETLQSDAVQFVDAMLKEGLISTVNTSE